MSYTRVFKIKSLGDLVDPAADVSKCIKRLSFHFDLANYNLENKIALEKVTIESDYVATIVREHLKEDLLLTLDQAFIDSIKKLYDDAHLLQKNIIKSNTNKETKFSVNQFKSIEKLDILTTKIISLFANEFGEYIPPSYTPQKPFIS